MALTEGNLNSNQNIKKEQLILNIGYNTETGKLILSDNYNNHYLCDLFGRIKTKYLPNVTGQANYTQRQNFYLRNKNIQNKLEILNRPNTSDPSFLNQKGKTEYYPSTRKFEGYTHFPRPLSPPFANIPNYQMKDETKKGLIKNLGKNFSEKNSKGIILKNNLNKGLSYMTTDLNEFDCIKVDSEKILELINKTLNSMKQKCNYKMDVYSKNPLVKALIQFKHYLLSNKDSATINNRRLRQPNSLIKKKYTNIQSAISHYGLRRKNQRLNNLNLDMNLNNIYTNKTATNYFRNFTADKKDKNYDLTLGRKIHMDFGSFSYEEEKKRIQNKKVVMTEGSNVGGRGKREITEGTKETQASEKNNVEEKIKDNNISFISNMREEEKNEDKEKKMHLKGINYFKKKCSKERLLLKGFQMKERKGVMYLLKNIRPKYRNNGELYLEDMEILKKANPIAFAIQKKKDEFDLKQLTKKVNTLRINADNVMKGKKLKISKKEEE